MDFKVKVVGHVKAEDKETGEILLDKNNAIHNENMALAIARGLANEQYHQIYRMSFGNGGTYVETGVSGGYQLHYNSPNIVDSDATLYHETYNEIIDDDAISSGNQVVTSTGSIENTFLVICSCTLSSTEPAGQSTDDSFDEVLTSSSSTEEVYSFDEMGLKTSDGKLLSHIIFNPIEKTANREIIFTYTLTISIC